MICWVTSRLALLLVLPIVCAYVALLANIGPAAAAPSLQLLWPTGEQHRIYGGYTYGCVTHGGPDMRLTTTQSTFSSLQASPRPPRLPAQSPLHRRVITRGQGTTSPLIMEAAMCRGISICERIWTEGLAR